MTFPRRVLGTHEQDVVQNAHVLLMDGSACCVTFSASRGLFVFKEGQPVADISLAAISSLASYADYPAANVVLKIAAVLEPGEMTGAHRDALVISVREWLFEAQAIRSPMQKAAVWQLRSPSAGEADGL